VQIDGRFTFFNLDEFAIQNDETAKYTMKRQFDERNHTKPCDIQIGNSVLRKTDRKENKLTPAYVANHYTVNMMTRDLELFTI
jgi:hypothetical protein